MIVGTIWIPTHDDAHASASLLLDTCRNLKMRKRLEFFPYESTSSKICPIKSFSKSASCCVVRHSPPSFSQHTRPRRITTLTTLDVSNNKLKELNPKLGTLTSVKSLNCDDNELIAGSLEPVSKLTKLQTLNAGGNVLGKKITAAHPHHHKHLPHKKHAQKPPPQQLPDPLPKKMPVSLKNLKLNSNFLELVPPPIFMLTKLQKLDLSHNLLAALPPEVMTLTSLNELNLNNNALVALPDQVGSLKKLKSLSLKHNQIRVVHKHQKLDPVKNPQPLPASLFKETPLIDLNLHGNPMTSTEINQFDGFSVFLERRAATNTKNIYGGAMANLSVTGLE